MTSRAVDKAVIVAGAAFAAVPLAIVSLFVLCPFVNDRTAAGLADDVAGVPSPADTRVVERFSLAGKLTGNGNGMQYLGGVLVQSDLSSDELDGYYAAYRKGDWDMLVDTQTTRDLGIIDRGDYAFASDVSDTSDGRWYIVYTWGDGIAPFSWFDLRGN